MSGSSFKPVCNRLVEGLPALQRRAFLAECQTVEMQGGQTLVTAGEPIKQVHFPLTAVFARVITVQGHSPLAVGLVGDDGMLGATLWLGQKHHSMQLLVQGSGTALEMSAQQFLRQLRLAPVLESLVASDLHGLIEELARNVVCHAFHEVRERLARWLLMSYDRSHGNELELTHQFLSDLLGVRRSAVTIAASSLREQGLIRYARGRIKVLSRAGLERAACGCHADWLQVCERHLSQAVPALKKVDRRFSSRPVQ